MKSYTSKDFDIDWFSGTGAGGQYRNKHQNCCRITHKETGLRSQSTKHRDRVSNQRAAFMRLAQMLIAIDSVPAERRDAVIEIVRTYHLQDGYVLDHSSKKRAQPKSVLDGNLDEFTEHPNRGNDRPLTGRQ